jgi:polyisoprenoid-binding protein YceI
MQNLSRYLATVGFALLLTLTGSTQGRFFTKTGKIEFFSKAPLEDIEAKNNSASALLDTKTGALQFSVLLKGFEFDKALMQEHFNENYVESDTYPKAEFRGTIVNNAAVNYAKKGTYPSKVKGQLTLHGVTRDVETTGTMKVDTDEIKAESSFTIKLSDYGIKLAPIVKDKISNTIRIVVDTKLEPLKG